MSRYLLIGLLFPIVVGVVAMMRQDTMFFQTITFLTGIFCLGIAGLLTGGFIKKRKLPKTVLVARDPNAKENYSVEEEEDNDVPDAKVQAELRRILMAAGQINTPHAEIDMNDEEIKVLVKDIRTRIRRKQEEDIRQRNRVSAALFSLGLPSFIAAIISFYVL